MVQSKMVHFEENTFNFYSSVIVDHVNYNKYFKHYFIYIYLMIK